ncbi:hypothetical protein M9458_040914, partial [Cirrhinus mrigala]
MEVFNDNTCSLCCSSVVCCVGFYLWQEELCLAGLTFALLLPGFRWYRADGDKRT